MIPACVQVIARLGAGLLFLLLFSGVPAQGSDRGKDFDPQAVEAIERMSDFLDQQQNISFKADDMIERAEEFGTPVQYSHQRTVSISRPDKLRIDVTGDLEHESLCYDGKRLIIDLKEQQAYAAMDASGSIDELLEMAARDYGVRRPVADLAYTGIAERVKKNANSIHYVGLHKASGITCHHVLFKSDRADWQVWIDAGETPVPRKIVINYHGVNSNPRYMLMLSDFKFPKAFPEGHFNFVPSQDAAEIPFEPLVTRKADGEQ